MTFQIIVEARILGERSEAGVGAVWLDLSATRMRIVDLVRQTVEEQVRTLTARRKLTAAEIERRLVRQYGILSQEDALRRRRIDVPRHDTTVEVERALEACRAGACLVVVDGEPLTDLDQEITVSPDTRVQFLRLLPLAGG